MSMWEKAKNKVAALLSRLKGMKHAGLIAAALAVGAMLLIYFGKSCFSSENAGINGGGGEYDYCAGVVEELESKLSQTEGVGEVSVLIYWSETAGGDESVYSPEGVIIICDGGNDIAVKLKLISSVAAYLGISENKINVLARGE